MEFIVAIDTREQRPYAFPCPTVRKKLNSGDYSVLGMESLVAVERKSKVDAYGTIGKGRDRFVSELERLSEMEYAAIVVESSMAEFVIPPEASRLNPKSAINSLIAWSIRYGVHVFFADSRIMGQTVTLRILEKFYREKTRGFGKGSAE